jgi:chromosome segregation ATPase
LIAKMEGLRAERQKLLNQRKCEILQDRLDGLELERERLKVKISELEKELERAQRRLEESRKEVEELDKQRTLVNRNLQRANALASEFDSNIKINAIAVGNLEGELDGFSREIVEQTDTIRRLERERDFYSHEATKLAHIVAARVDVMKRLDTNIFDHKKKLADLEISLKSQVQNYEAAVVEKQYYERALRETVVRPLPLFILYKDKLKHFAFI